MKKLLVCALVALVLPAVASGKEVQSLKVCGAGECKSMSRDDAQPYIALLQRGGPYGGDASDVTTPVRAQPFYRLVFEIGAEGEKPFTVTSWYVRPGLTRWDLTQPFRRIPAELVKRLDALASGVDAIPAPSVVSARVNGKTARDAARYGALFGNLPAAKYSYSEQARAKVMLRVAPDRPNPWFSANRAIRFSAKTRVLYLATPVRVPTRLATSLARDGHFALSGIAPLALLAVVILTGGAAARRRRRLLLLGVTLAALALPTAALGKEVESVSVCGASGCKEVQGVAEPMARAFEGEQVSAVLGAVPVSSFYRIGLRIRGDDPPARQFSAELWYVRPNLIRWKDNRDVSGSPFRRMPAALAERVAAVAGTLTPYPAPRVVRGWVNDKPIADPRAYIGLFGKLPSTDTQLAGGERWLTITLAPDRANPWFSADNALMYVNKQQSLYLVKPLHVDDALAERIARDAGVPSPVRGGGTGWVAPAGIGAFGVVAAIAAASFWRRRRSHPTTA
jgi:hypothetical protein